MRLYDWVRIYEEPKPPKGISRECFRETSSLRVVGTGYKDRKNTAMGRPSVGRTKDRRLKKKTEGHAGSHHIAHRQRNQRDDYYA